MAVSVHLSVDFFASSLWTKHLLAIARVLLIEILGDFCHEFGGWHLVGI